MSTKDQRDTEFGLTMQRVAQAMEANRTYPVDESLYRGLREALSGEFHVLYSAHDAEVEDLTKQLAALTAERDAVTRHRDKWRDNYMTVADAVAAESESAEHLADIARKARNDRDHYKQVFDESCEHVAEACDMLGFNRSDGPRDTWTLRESCGRVVRERDAARSERDASNAARESQWKELQAARAANAAGRELAVDTLATECNTLGAEVTRLREENAGLSMRLADAEERAEEGVRFGLELSDARAALRGALTVLEDHDSCGGRRLTGYVFPECGREFPVSIDAIKAALASTPAPAAVPATRLCPCGELACAGVDDDANHQCGGPKEACGAAGCQECAAPDPVQAAQREGSITHADLMAVRERYGALYAAVFPIVPTLLCMFIERSSSPSDRKSAREAYAQLEACK